MILNCIKYFKTVLTLYVLTKLGHFKTKRHQWRLAKTFQLLHSRVGSLLYPQTLNWAGKAYQGETLKLITNIRKLHA
jgi:hypothetical protein